MYAQNLVTTYDFPQDPDEQQRFIKGVSGWIERVGAQIAGATRHDLQRTIVIQIPGDIDEDDIERLERLLNRLTYVHDFKLMGMH